MKKLLTGLTLVCSVAVLSAFQTVTIGSGAELEFCTRGSLGNCVDRIDGQGATCIKLGGWGPKDCAGSYKVMIRP